MKQQNQFSTSSQAEQMPLTQETQQQSTREFGSPEEMLRHDALHTPVPPAIAHRLQESIGRTPPPSPAWWRKLFRTKS